MQCDEILFYEITSKIMEFNYPWTSFGGFGEQQLYSENTVHKYFYIVLLLLEVEKTESEKLRTIYFKYNLHLI